MKNYIKRLKAERDELNNKIVKVKLFLDSGKGDFMDAYLLDKQLNAMTEYRDALSSRLICATTRARLEFEAERTKKENQIDPEDNPETMLETEPSAEETALREIEKVIHSLKTGEPFKIGCGEGLYLGDIDMNDVVRSGIIYVLGVHTKELKHRIKDMR